MEVLCHDSKQLKLKFLKNKNMMMLTIKKYRLIVLMIAFSVFFTACKKGWTDHNAVTDPNLNINLYQAIKQYSGTSVFTSLLEKTGYDKILASSKSYTVWVPSDSALANLPASITGDTAKLKKFVANHIANGPVQKSDTTQKRIPVLSGKYINISTTQFDSATIISPNQYASNGIFYKVDKYVPVIDNCWDWLNNSTTVTNSKTFLLSLNYNYFDSTKGVQIGVDPNTGLPVYQAGTGITVRNKFLDNVMDISDEKSEYTFIVLNDGSYTTELTKLTPWFKTSTTDSTNTLAGSWLVKDLAFKGSYSAAKLPDTLISQYGVKVPVDKTKITASYKTSNGWVHVMSQVNFNLTYKFPPLIIQGETPTSFAADRTAQTFYRARWDSVNNRGFNDILMQNYSYASYWINYLVKNVNSMRYNAYWVAINDIQTTPLWTQRLAVDSTTTTGNFAYVTVAYKNYTEVSLGQITIPRFKNINLYVVGANTSSSSGGGTSISLDYIKLVPAF